MIITDSSELIKLIRQQRKDVCFSVINRGQLWYDRLTSEQIIELKDWYNRWLNAPETLEIPKTPEWINKKTTEEEIKL